MPKRAPVTNELLSANDHPAVIMPPPDKPVVKGDEASVLRPGQSGYGKIESGKQVENQTVSPTEALNPKYYSK